MKKIYCILLFVVGLSLFAIGAHADINDGLVAYYPLDGNAQDFSGSGNHGTEYNGVSYAPGIKGQAARFDGIDDYIKASSDGLPTGERTVSLWFYADTIRMPRPVLLGYGGGDGWGSCGTSWFMMLAPDPEPYFYLSGHCHSYDLYAPYPHPPIGDWYHLAITTSAEGTKFFVNGQQMSSNPLFINNTIVLPGRDLAIGVDVWYQGYAPYTDINVGYFAGMIDEVRIYNRALSEQEISYLSGFTITSSSRLSVTLNEFSSFQLEAKGGLGSLAWSVVDGDLPPGMNFSPDGILSGTPAQTGQFNFNVRVTDSEAHIVEKSFTLDVVLIQPPPSLRVSKTGSIPVPGRIVDYFISVENVGTVSAGVYIHELLLPPSDYIFVSANPAPDFEEEGLIYWDIDSLKPGEARIIQYSVRLSPDVALGSTTTGFVHWKERLAEVSLELARRQIEKNKLESKEEWHAMLDELETMECTNKNELPYTRQYIDDFFDVCVDTDTLGWIKGVLGCTFATANLKTSLNILLKDCNDFSDAGICNSPENWVTVCNNAVGALDPNEKLVIASKYIQPDQLLVYPIHFENIGTIEARDIFVTDVLDTNLDLSTLELLTPDEASIDLATRTIRWGLLNRNLLPGETDNVLFSIKPIPGLPSGTVIRNDATIQFEVFDPFTTNEVVNIVDTTKPVGIMDPLPAETSTIDFQISWNGSDAVGEIDYYTVLVSEDGGNFTPFVEKTSETSATFTGESGKTYGFICIAVDTAGNIEIQDPVAETVTQIITNREPIARCQDVTVPTESGLCNAQASINAGSSDPDGDPITIEQTPPSPYSRGTTDVTLIVTDDKGKSSSCTSSVTVVDNSLPVLEVSLSPDTLWPPNHKMVAITPTISSYDNCAESPEIRLVSITMNEGDETNTYDPDYDTTQGDGDTINDIQVDADGNIFLRAERSGLSEGRVYILTYEAKDSSGNVSTTTSTVSVPHDMN